MYITFLLLLLILVLFIIYKKLDENPISAPRPLRHQSLRKHQPVTMFYINLLRSTDRRKHIENLKIKYNMPLLRRFNAYDGKNKILNETEFLLLEKHINKNKNSKIVNGECGCILSHYYLWKTIIKNQYEYTLICEDDILIKKNITKELETLKDEDYDIIFLFNDKKEIRNKKTKIITMHKSFWFGCGTLCYFITLKGAKKLISIAESKGFNQPVDHWMYNTPLDIGILTHPFIFKDDIFKISFL
jgi:glycosyl transferase family 25